MQWNQALYAFLKLKNWFAYLLTENCSILLSPLSLKLKRYVGTWRKPDKNCHDRIKHSFVSKKLIFCKYFCGTLCHALVKIAITIKVIHTLIVSKCCDFKKIVETCSNSAFSSLKVDNNHLNATLLVTSFSNPGMRGWHFFFFLLFPLFFSLIVNFY